MRPKTLTFNFKDYKEDEECPFCHITTWLGVGENGIKMCQKCYLAPDKTYDDNKKSR